MPKKTELALSELERRWRDIFSTLEAGGEVPPSQRLRTEGYMEAVVDQGICDEEQLQSRMLECYTDCRDTPLPSNWKELFPFPQVPGFGRRAPVFRSTSD